LDDCYILSSSSEFYPFFLLDASFHHAKNCGIILCLLESSTFLWRLRTRPKPSFTGLLGDLHLLWGSRNKDWLLDCPPPSFLLMLRHVQNPILFSILCIVHHWRGIIQQWRRYLLEQKLKFHRNVISFSTRVLYVGLYQK